ncbi:MAG: hypothetical protein JXQ75_00255 [Phycisphaerae bacterium]|nr:hypothetical protein [Phycisphaerae bacterium]
MRLRAQLCCLVALSAGCTGDYVVSGSLLMPAGLTLNDDCSCSDITVRVEKTIDGVPTGSVTTQAQGDITTGHCEYTLTVSPGNLFSWHRLGATVRPLHYAECGNDAIETTFDGASLGALVGFGGTIQQDLQATASCE